MPKLMQTAKSERKETTELGAKVSEGKEMPWWLRGLFPRADWSLGVRTSRSSISKVAFRMLVRWLVKGSS